MPDAPSPHAIRTVSLGKARRHAIDLRPDAQTCADIARDLGFLGLRKLSFTGALVPQSDADWRLEARLGASVVQDCVVTLEPVTTRIDTEVARLYLAHYEEPQDAEAEMPQDDTAEPLGTWIDPFDVMLEALALAAPDYPRKEGVALGETVLSEPGVAPMTDDDARPFAGLAALRDALERDGD